MNRRIADQLFRSGTSIGANIEEAQGSHGSADFIAKMVIARKEARETRYWLRLILDERLLPPEQMQNIVDESDQIVRIIAAIVTNARRNAGLEIGPKKSSPSQTEDSAADSESLPDDDQAT